MKLRENLSTPPFLDQPPPFQLSTPFLQKFSKPPPFSQFWETPTPPLGRGGPSYVELKRLNITECIFSWISSFPKRKEQIVKIDNIFFKPTPIRSGVPQGSVLSPILFLILMIVIDEHIYESLRLLRRWYQTIISNKFPPSKPSVTRIPGPCLSLVRFKQHVL